MQKKFISQKFVKIQRILPYNPYEHSIAYLQIELEVKDLPEGPEGSLSWGRICRAHVQGSGLGGMPLGEKAFESLGCALVSFRVLGGCWPLPGRVHICKRGYTYMASA